MGGIHLIDLLIVAVIFLMVLTGFKVGLIASFFNVCGILIGLLAASRYYAPFADLINHYLEIQELEADTVGFVVLFIAVYISAILIGILLSAATRFRVIRMVNKLGGSVAGLVMGIGLTGIILMFLGTFPLLPDFNIKLQESRLGPGIVNMANGTYEDLKHRLDLPGLNFFPESSKKVTPSDVSNINFSRLDGATCFACTGKVDFLGYFKNNFGTQSPKFICPDCSRTSDGCQTYEGYHLLYEECPAVMGRRGYRFDCGIWPNNSFVRPTAVCPVCGESNAAVYFPGLAREVLLE